MLLLPLFVPQLLALLLQPGGGGLEGHGEGWAMSLWPQATALANAFVSEEMFYL